MKEQLIQKLVNAWPSAIVARREVERFSGGAVRAGTLANCDSRGEGPKDKFRVGKNTAYYAQSLAEWIAERLDERPHGVSVRGGGNEPRMTRDLVQ